MELLRRNSEIVLTFSNSEMTAELLSLHHMMCSLLFILFLVWSFFSEIEDGRLSWSTSTATSEKSLLLAHVTRVNQSF